MRIISRAIFRDVFSPTLLGLLTFTFILFIRDLGKLLEMIVSSTASLGLLGELCLLLLPNIFLLTIPMSVLLGILVGLGRLSADNEVIALRATGRSILDFVKPVLGLAAIAACINISLSLYFLPLANQMKTGVLAHLANTQIGADISPRVFEEQFPNLILYVQDIRGDQWSDVFLVDTTQPSQPKITLAERSTLIVDRTQDKLQLYLAGGSTHLLSPNNPSDYSLIHFSHSEIPLPAVSRKVVQSDKRVLSEFSTPELLALIRLPNAKRSYRVELHRRLALPFACVVLALLGIPLGISARKGGKSYGFVLSLMVLSVYYLLMVSGSRFAEDGRLSPLLGCWGANILFLIIAVTLILIHERHVIRLFKLGFLELPWARRPARRAAAAANLTRPASGLRSLVRVFFPHVLDEYILRGFFAYTALALAAFIVIFVIFTVFELIPDIVRNNVPFLIVANYFIFLTPQITYLVTPIAVLVATLVNFGLLTKTNQITAMKACGLSLYRLSVSLLFSAALLSVGMFLLQDFVLPTTNQKQDAYRNIIKGRPPQTYFRPNQKWIVGQESGHLRIFYYNFYDPDGRVFRDLSVFDIQLQSFAMSRRIFAKRVYWDPFVQKWVFDDGWVRNFADPGDTLYKTFNVNLFPEINEDPSYFVKVVKLSEQMNARELWAYIQSLQQSGFDVVRLMVQYYRKFAYPFTAFIMTLIAIPFSFSTGRKGALYGVGLSIVIGIIYWAVAGLFEAMGGFNKLHPLLAAWSPNMLFGLCGAYLLLTIDT